MPPQRHFGSIPNYQVGSLFADRRELSAATVHRPPQAGISGSKTDGADSIVLNGGYVDDEDYGDAVVYTGHGGQDGGRKQVRDQELTDSGNWALKISYEEQLPVRVIRGPKGAPQWSPATGYRYDGLYISLIVIGQIRASMDIGFGATDLNALTNPRLLNLQKVAPLGELQSHPIGR